MAADRQPWRPFSYLGWQCRARGRPVTGSSAKVRAVIASLIRKVLSNYYRPRSLTRTSITPTDVARDDRCSTKVILICTQHMRPCHFWFGMYETSLLCGRTRLSPPSNKLSSHRIILLLSEWRLINKKYRPRGLADIWPLLTCPITLPTKLHIIVTEKYLYQSDKKNIGQVLFYFRL